MANLANQKKGLPWVPLFFAVLIIQSSSSFAFVLRTAAQDSDLFKYDLSNPKAPGFCMELIQKVHERDSSIAFQIIPPPLPLFRIERELEDRQLDVFFCFLKNADREKRMSFLPIELYKVQHVLVSRKGEPISIENYDELRAFSKNNSILVQQNSALVSFLKTQGIRIDDGTKDYSAMLQKLIARRGKALYVQNLGIQKAIKKEKLSDLVQISKNPLKEERLYVAYSKSAPQKAIKKLEGVLNMLDKNGELKKLFKKYAE